MIKILHPSGGVSYQNKRKNLIIVIIISYRIIRILVGFGGNILVAAFLRRFYLSFSSFISFFGVDVLR